MPTAALAGVLVVTGWRLVSLTHAKHLFRQYGLLPTAAWAVTFVMVVATDLLTGVLVGLAFSLLELAPYLRNLKLHLRHRDDGDVSEVEVSGAATCVNLPRLAKHLDEVPDGRAVRIRFKDVVCLDHTCAELIREWAARKRKRGDAVEYDLGNERKFYRMLAQPAH
jgi:MFS superfamily sulfate permease-like transporter